MSYAMGKYRLLALDMDGTLLDDKGEVSAENARWVKHAMEAGVQVCLSTGRGYASAFPYAEQLQLNSPMITVNGGEIWTWPNTLYSRTTVAADKIALMYELAKAYSDVWFWGYSTERIYNKDEWPDEIAEHEWLKFGYYIEDLAVIEEILAKLQTWEGLELTNSSPYNIEINAEGVSKAAALIKVCRMLGIDMSEVVSVGDSLNDIAAIRASGLGVAMANAQEEVKAAANIVTASNEEHGVAQVIRNYVLRT